MYTALTIAGSDPSGGAGIQGDLKTFFAHGVYGMAVITALTAQSTTGVSGVFDIPPEFVAKQLETVLYDMPVGGAKTGMVSVTPTIEAIAAVLEKSRVPNLVVDPVMVATSGDPLLQDDAVEALKGRLFRLATVVTPNVPEAERLTGIAIDSVEAMREAAKAISRTGPWAVLVKGGHLPGDEITDLLYCTGDFVEYRDPRVKTQHTHGTGCALAAGIAAQLAKRADLRDAVARARDFVRTGLEQAVVLGRGTNPLNHLAGRAGAGE